MSHLVKNALLLVLLWAPVSFAAHDDEVKDNPPPKADSAPRKRILKELPAHLPPDEPKKEVIFVKPGLLERRSRLTEFLKEHAKALSLLGVKKADGHHVVSKSEANTLKNRLAIALQRLPEEIRIRTRANGGALLDGGGVVVSVSGEKPILILPDGALRRVDDGERKEPTKPDEAMLRILQSSGKHGLFFLIRPGDRHLVLAAKVKSVKTVGDTTRIALKDLNLQAAQIAVDAEMKMGAERVGVTPTDYRDFFVKYETGETTQIEVGPHSEFVRLRLSLLNAAMREEEE